ncbi:MAG: hypothetical protein ACYSSP_07145 [Planctomycetota bacterium]|jgi:hypothetical protein
MTLAFYIHYILAQDSEKGFEWGNILFIAIFIVFWAVNALLRSKANKESKQEKPVSKGETKPKTRQKSLVEMMIQEVLGGSKQEDAKPRPQRPMRRTRPVVKKQSQAFAKQTKYLKKSIPDDAFTFDSAPDVLKETRGIKFSDKDLRLKSSQLSKGKVSKEQISQIVSLSQLLGEGRGELEKAILYYEILGKPLSLRESQSFLI